MLAPFDLLSAYFKLELRLSLGIFLHAEAISFIQSLHFSKEIKINFWVSYIVFVVHLSLMYKIDLCVCYSISLYKFLQCFTSLKKTVTFPFFSPLQQD